jgi:hypothetical protein
LEDYLFSELEGEDDPDKFATAYLRVGYVAERGLVIEAVQEWASDPPDETDVMHADWPLNSRDAAYQYFRDNEEDASQVGVEVVQMIEEATTRTSGMAKLGCPVEAANEAAEALGRPERFRRR